MNEQYPLALPIGSVLAGKFVIEKVLGQGGFGITYKATDHQTGDLVAIKEFFPDSMATRSHTTVMPFSGERGDSYSYGKECFLQEAETLAQFIGNDNIVRIHSYFEENGTAYFVMDYIEGTSFDEYIKQHGGRLPFDETVKILVPIMDSLGAVHSKGIVHRDVTPDNIYITNDGKVKLLDFGAARYSLGDKSRSLDVVLKHGFAPKEQYTRHGRQGPYTDIYSLGATFYFALSGRKPPDSVERMDEDELIPLSTLGAKISEAAEAAILKAMSVQPADRYQSMAEFKSALLSIQLEKLESQLQSPAPTGSESVHIREFNGPGANGSTPVADNPSQNTVATNKASDISDQALTQVKKIVNSAKNTSSPILKGIKERAEQYFDKFKALPKKTQRLLIAIPVIILVLFIVIGVVRNAKSAQEKAQTVNQMISSLYSMNYPSRDYFQTVIDADRAYNSLSKKAKAYVDDYSTLESCANEMREGIPATPDVLYNLLQLRSSTTKVDNQQIIGTKTTQGWIFQHTEEYVAGYDSTAYYDLEFTSMMDANFNNVSFFCYFDTTPSEFYCSGNINLANDGSWSGNGNSTVSTSNGINKQNIEVYNFEITDAYGTVSFDF